MPEIMSAEECVSRIEVAIRDHLKNNGWQLINGDASKILDVIESIKVELEMVDSRSTDIDWGL